MQLSAVPSLRQIHVVACLAKERVPPQNTSKSREGTLSQRMPKEAAVRPSGRAAGTMLEVSVEGGDIRCVQASREGRLGRMQRAGKTRLKRHSRTMRRAGVAMCKHSKPNVHTVHRSFRLTSVGCSEGATMHRSHRSQAGAAKSDGL